VVNLGEGDTTSAVYSPDGASIAASFDPAASGEPNSDATTVVSKPDGSDATPLARLSPPISFLDTVLGWVQWNGVRRPSDRRPPPESGIVAVAPAIAGCP